MQVIFIITFSISTHFYSVFQGKGLVHGEIRCRNVYVAEKTEKLFKVEETDFFYQEHSLLSDDDLRNGFYLEI